jgi:hypothetical protein
VAISCVNNLILVVTCRQGIRITIIIPSGKVRFMLISSDMAGTNITDLVNIKKIETVFYILRLRILQGDSITQEAG